MNITITRPTTAEVQGKHELEDGTAIGAESPQLKARISELEGILKDGASIRLVRDWEGIAYAQIDGDDRFFALCLLDDGRVGYGGINHPAFHPTVAAYLEAGEYA